MGFWSSVSSYLIEVGRENNEASTSLKVDLKTLEPKKSEKTEQMLEIKNSKE